MIVPGAVDVPPLNVQSSKASLFVNVHVSIQSSPLTPNARSQRQAVTTNAQTPMPPKLPVTSAGIVPPTSLVVTMNVALARFPASTVTLAGTRIGSPPDRDTTAPREGPQRSGPRCL
jgi:hypothetical protein